MNYCQDCKIKLNKKNQDPDMKLKTGEYTGYYCKECAKIVRQYFFNTKKTKICKGCISIKEDLFPFTKFSEGGRKGQFIDQVGCGVNGNQFLEIRYCPVCGKKYETANL